MSGILVTSSRTPIAVATTFRTWPPRPVSSSGMAPRAAPARARRRYPYIFSRRRRRICGGSGATVGDVAERRATQPADRRIDPRAQEGLTAYADGHRPGRRGHRRTTARPVEAVGAHGRRRSEDHIIAMAIAPGEGFKFRPDQSTLFEDNNEDMN